MQGRFEQTERVALNPQPSRLSPQPSTFNPEAGSASWELLCCSPSSKSMARLAWHAVLPFAGANLALLAVAALLLLPVVGSVTHPTECPAGAHGACVGECGFRLQQGEVLLQYPGGELRSDDDALVLRVLDSGNAVIMNVSGGNGSAVVWETGTGGVGAGPFEMVLQSNHAFVLLDSADTIIWSTNSSAEEAPDGSEVLYPVP